ncbi:XRE family transcriptional regulator [Amycolatopsis rhabdoformis]|uniref:XRE family transcriptional regulator n=1 Tax=Amycolatopsis rhabdoformis TaxID=1448059 RepID=A0ABZ1IGV0_9PSEU|nr:XRE family transcriptional regulator [Amycolatopsis rhabdoformis]WSE33321.1 XRE family transcriptional regulator [Amycolatopsis rhabdoformis]
MSAQHPGSFAVTLDAAIEDSGLSLDRVRHHLAARGVTLSRSALSYWRRGRSRPERETSLNAVTQLEAVLELSPGSLTSLLGPRAPRGRWLGHPPDRVERRRLWPDLRPLAADLKPPPDGQLSFWSVHDRVAIDDNGCERALHVWLVAEATMDGVDRMMTYHQADGPLTAEPRYQGVRFARVGRVRVDRETGMTAGELVLDRVLAAGEVTAVEYEIVLPPGTPTREYGRRFTRPVREYVCQVQFGLRLPRQVRSFDRRGPDGPRHTGDPLRVGTTHAVTFATRDVRPGICGACWTW